MSGMYGAFGALAALRARDRTGQGQCVDLALYESVFRVLDELAPAYQKFGVVRERMGADTVNVCPHSHYQTRDDKWIALACSNDVMFERLAGAMGDPSLARADRYGPVARRLTERDEVNAIVGEWVRSLDGAEVLARCEAAGVPAGGIYSIADIFADPQYEARGNMRPVESRIGPLAVPAVVPRLGATPGGIEWLGEPLGASNAAVLGGLLGIADEELDALRAQGVI